MKLGDFTYGKDNNFNLIRLVAALAVLVTHSFAIATGDPANEPLRGWLGMTIGDFAVDAFFVTSGFLVTASLANRQAASEFIWARVLRIYPAILVMLVLTVLVAGPWLTSFSIPDYLGSRNTLRYLVKCSTLIFGVEYLLPGVFDGNPYKAVNGSLWSMPWELRMYILLLSLWLCARATGGEWDAKWKRAVVGVFGVACLAVVATHLAWPKFLLECHLLFMFFTGAAFYILRNWIVLSGRWALVASVLLITSSFSREYFFFAYNLTIAYLLFWIAYVPRGVIRHFNSIGDYSYGTYIYAFPVQQIVVTIVPGISVLMLILISGGATLLVAIGSWHIVEKRALSFKRRSGKSNQQPVLAS